MLYDLNWIDYILIGIFALSTLAGLSRGLVREVISLLTLFAAFMVATLFANSLATSFMQSETVQNVAGEAAQPSTAALGLSFAVLFIATWIVGAIIGAIIKAIMRGRDADFVNRLLGGIFGFCKGFLLCVVLIFVVQMTTYANDETWKASVLVNKFQPAIAWVSEHVSPALQGIMSQKSE